MLIHNVPYCNNKLYAKILTEMHWKHYNNTVPLLNYIKIPTMPSVESFKIFQIYQYLLEDPLVLGV